MNKIFNIMAGTGDYRHVMFSTTDWSKASKFVTSFNMQFHVNDPDTYDAYHVYIEEVDNFVPQFFGKYAYGNATVYTVVVYDGGIIKPAEIYGSPLYNYIDLYKTKELGMDVEKLQHLLDHEYCIDFNNVFRCDAIVKILIVDPDTQQSFDTTYNSDISGHMLNHLVKRASTIYKREKQYVESMNETESD